MHFAVLRSATLFLFALSTLSSALPTIGQSANADLVRSWIWEQKQIEAEAQVSESKTTNSQTPQQRQRQS